jgi:hypothetical protein
MLRVFVFAYFFLFLLLPLDAQAIIPTVSYQIAFVPDNLSLNVYSAASSRELIGSLSNGTILSPSGAIDGEWFGIEFEGQAAWVNQDYVMGNVDEFLFCGDSRVQTVIDSLKEAIRNRDGEAFASLVAPQGLYLGLQERTQRLSMSEVRAFFDEQYPRFWGFDWNEEPLIYSLGCDVLALLDADLLAENVQVACQDNQDNLSINTVLYAVNVPGNYRITNFYSFLRPGEAGYEMDWGAWGIGFSYWEDQPRVFALGHYVWVP